MTTYIYALVDPRTGDIRYIGKSDNPRVRYMWHLCPSTRYENDHKARWISLLARQNLKPILLVLEEVCSEVWPERESHWIAHFRMLGARLTNLSSGGDGFQDMPEAVRKKISEKLKGHPVSEETRRKMRENRQYSPLSEEHRAKISAANKGKLKSPETCAKLSAALTGHRYGPHSEDTKRKMSESHKGRVFAPEHCAAISAGKKGKSQGKLTDEHRCRIGDGLSKYYETHVVPKSFLGKTHTEEARRKQSEGMKRAWARKKQVI